MLVVIALGAIIGAAATAITAAVLSSWSFLAIVGLTLLGGNIAALAAALLVYVRPHVIRWFSASRFDAGPRSSELDPAE